MMMSQEDKDLIKDLEQLEVFQKYTHVLLERLSKEASEYQSRYRVSQDPELAEIAKYYVVSCDAVRKVVHILEANEPMEGLEFLLQSRRKRVPSLWRRLFPKKTKQLRTVTGDF